MKKRILGMVMAVMLLAGMCFNLYSQAAYATSDYENGKKPLFHSTKADKSAYQVPTFPDVNQADAYSDFITKLGYLQLFRGDNYGNFNPDSTITRAEFAALICRMLGYENEAINHQGEVVFNDVPANHWSSGYIYVASKLGIINGYGNGNFGPEDPVLYEQAIKMALCAIEYDEPMLCTSYGLSCIGGNIAYPDGYVKLAQKVDLYGDFNQSEQAPRKVIAELLYRALLKNSLVEETDYEGVPYFAQSGDTLLQSVYGIASEEEWNQLAAVTYPDSRKVKLEELIDVDYKTLKAFYGMPELVAYYPRGGIGYQFKGIDALFLFSDTWQVLGGTIYSNDPNFPEPKDHVVCQGIYTDMKTWLQTDERGITIKSLDDVQNNSPISQFTYNHDDIASQTHYVGENAGYSVWITYDEKIYPISDDSAVEIINTTDRSTATSDHYEVVVLKATTADMDEYALILCKNNGKFLWSYQTGYYPLTELTPISGAYIDGDRVYVCEAHNLIAFDKATGKMIWESTNAISYSTNLIFDDKNIYGSAYYGPHFIVISKENGEILHQGDSEIYHRPVNIKVDETTFYVAFDASEEGLLETPMVVEMDITPYR